MAASKRDTPPIPIPIERDSDTPVFRQIYVAIREAILSGRLEAGSRLPPSRELAADIGVSRATAVLALEHLEAEGYVHGRGAAGSFVAELVLSHTRPPRLLERIDPRIILPSTVNIAEPLLSIGKPVPFRVGEPALDAFPSKLWTRLYTRCARSEGASLLGYGDPHGYFPLREAIAAYVAVSRSVHATADQVILVRGAQQGMDLTARVLLQPDDEVWVEDPGYLATRSLLQLAGARLIPIPVDGEGLNVDDGRRLAPSAKMACVAPSHQFPLGRTLSLPRRLALLAWARTANAWIVEDDFDSEFRYAGTPLASLQGLDTSDRVIYVGTFSKTVYPALRLGYLIVPPQLVESFRGAAAMFDHLSPTLEQATLARFIEEGHFTRHMKRMRALYRERQQALLDAASSQLEGLLHLEAAGTGMHVVGWLQEPHTDDRLIEQRAAEHGIELRALSRYCMSVTLPPGLILGFAAVPAMQLTHAVTTLREILMH